jgi:hypothetical protein
MLSSEVPLSGNPPGIPDKTARHLSLGCLLNTKPDFQPFQDSAEWGF